MDSGDILTALGYLFLVTCLMPSVMFSQHQPTPKTHLIRKKYFNIDEIGDNNLLKTQRFLKYIYKDIHYTFVQLKLNWEFMTCIARHHQGAMAVFCRLVK